MKSSSEKKKRQRIKIYLVYIKCQPIYHSTKILVAFWMETKLCVMYFVVEAPSSV
jgi:hypothetical protein